VDHLQSAVVVAVQGTVSFKVSEEGEGREKGGNQKKFGRRWEVEEGEWRNGKEEDRGGWRERGREGGGREGGRERRETERHPPSLPLGGQVPLLPLPPPPHGP
jgi:hypothetical protein